MKKIIFNNLGMGMTELIIASGLVGVITVAMNRGFELSKKQVVFTRSQNDAVEVINLIQANILDMTACNANFGAQQAERIGPNALTQLLDDSGNAFLTSGGYGAIGNLEIVNFTTERSTTSANHLDFNVHFRRNDSRKLGVRTFTRSIPIPVNYNAVDPNIVDSCRAIEDQVEDVFQEFTCDDGGTPDPALYDALCNKKSFANTLNLSCPAGQYQTGIEYDPAKFPVGGYGPVCAPLTNLQLVQPQNCGATNLLKGSASTSKCSALDAAELNEGIKTGFENCLGSHTLWLKAASSASSFMEIGCDSSMAPPTTTTTTIVTTTTLPPGPTTTTASCSPNNVGLGSVSSGSLGSNKGLASGFLNGSPVHTSGIKYPSITYTGSSSKFLRGSLTSSLKLNFGDVTLPETECTKGGRIVVQVWGTVTLGVAASISGSTAQNATTQGIRGMTNDTVRFDRKSGYSGSGSCVFEYKGNSSSGGNPGVGSDNDSIRHSDMSFCPNISPGTKVYPFIKVWSRTLLGGSSYNRNKCYFQGTSKKCSDATADAIRGTMSISGSGTVKVNE